MRTPLARGIVVVSVCCESGSPLSVGQLNAVRRLLDECERLQIHATWAVAQPGQSPATRFLVGHNDQEVALAATGAADVSTTQFTKNLLRGVLAGGAFGAPLSTLFVAEAPSPAALEVMAKYGIGALCRIDAARRAAAAPRRLRFGIDEFVPHATFPRSGAWFGGEFRRISGALQSASQQRMLVHLALDISRIAAADRMLGQAQKVLTAIAKLVREGRLESATIRSAVDRLAMCRSGQPAISILRRAA